MVAIEQILTRFLLPTIPALIALRYSAGILAWRAANNLERPTYRVLRRLSSGVEIRRYEPYLIAETEIDASKINQDGNDVRYSDEMRASAGNGFRICAGYIFGKNKRRGGTSSEPMKMTAPVRTANEIDEGSEKMQMTAPVRMIGGGGSEKKKMTKVSFVIGSKYSLRTAPKPLDSSVKLRNVPSHILAVRSFSGAPPKESRVAAERTKILNSLEEADLSVDAREGSETLVYGYHDPIITPNLLRRNEVCVKVDSKCFPLGR
mmetsp:Transcript_3729/g.6915  ORF Transcript_3729/g.6915 Transcript_3729/m.6915 type:complete len:262 (-) Transcript_3729:305-1090(-)